MLEHDHIAKSVASSYLRSCRWADWEDLRQEAWVAILQARGTWDGNRGVPFPAYARRAAVLSVHRYLWRSGKPVSGPPERLKEAAPAVADVPVEDLVAPEPPEISGRGLAIFLRLALGIVLGIRDGAAAARVLLKGEKPGLVARETGIPARRVYHVSCLARKRLRGNRWLKAMAADLV